MHEERGGHLELLDSLPPDDGVAKGKFEVIRLHEVPTTGYEGPILDHADTTNPKVVETIQNLPTRWLTSIPASGRARCHWRSKWKCPRREPS